MFNNGAIIHGKINHHETGFIYNFILLKTKKELSRSQEQELNLVNLNLVEKIIS